MVEAWSDKQYRKSRTMLLCSACYQTLVTHPDPIFELLFSLKEKERELSIIARELEQFFESRLEKTPERIAELERQEAARKQFQEEYEAKRTAAGLPGVSILK
jgi:hypothetical protein